MGGLGLLLLAALIASLFFRQQIIDHVHAYEQRDNQTIARYADVLKTTYKGSFLLRASQAQVDDRTSFNKNCGGLVEKTVVLGCYSGQRIYVYNVSDPRLEGIKEVTMAHELLHAVYERLDTRQKADVNKLLEQQYASVTDERFREVVKSYEKLEPGEQLNELHSMLATEQARLSPALEQYYNQYFNNREAIVQMSKNYEDVFRELENKQKALVDELNTIAADLEKSSAAYQKNADLLMRDIEAFNARARRGEFSSRSAFDATRTALAARQDALELERNRINRAIDTYNEDKKQLDELNLQAAELHKSIDSIQTRKLPSL